MPGTVSPFPGRSSRGVFCRRRLIGFGRRGIALAVLASLFVYLRIERLLAGSAMGPGRFWRQGGEMIFFAPGNNYH